MATKKAVKKAPAKKAVAKKAPAKKAVAILVANVQQRKKNAVARNSVCQRAYVSSLSSLKFSHNLKIKKTSQSCSQTTSLWNSYAVALTKNSLTNSQTASKLLLKVSKLALVSSKKTKTNFYFLKKRRLTFCKSSFFVPIFLKLFYKNHVILIYENNFLSINILSSFYICK